MTYTIREVIHHGDYSHQREVTLPDLSHESLRDLLRTSQYCYDTDVNPMTNQRVVALRADLMAGQEHRAIGWSTFTMVKGGGDRLEEKFSREC